MTDSELRTALETHHSESYGWALSCCALSSVEAEAVLQTVYLKVLMGMESGEVIRMEMPRSALIAFGLPVNVDRADTPVKAELLLGEDGMARAIRFLR
jgi:hypothetical protein